MRQWQSKTETRLNFFSRLSPMRLACRVVTPPQCACMQRIALGFATNSKQVERPYRYVVAYSAVTAFFPGRGYAKTNETGCRANERYGFRSSTALPLLTLMGTETCS